MNEKSQRGRSIYLALLSCLVMAGLSAAIISASSLPGVARAGSAVTNDTGCGASAQIDGLVKPGLPGKPRSAQKKGGGGGSPVRCRIVTPTVGDNSTYSCVSEGRGCPGQRQQCVLIRVGTTDGYCECQ